MWILLSPFMLSGLLYVLTIWTADCFTIGADAYKKIKKRQDNNDRDKKNARNIRR